MRDFIGYVAEGNRRNEEVIGKHDVKDRIVKGQMMVDCKRMGMDVMNTYFKKREEHG